MYYVACGLTKWTIVLKIRLWLSLEQYSITYEQITSPFDFRCALGNGGCYKYWISELFPLIPITLTFTNLRYAWWALYIIAWLVLLAIVLSVLHLTASDYPCGRFQLFIQCCIRNSTHRTIHTDSHERIGDNKLNRVCFNCNANHQHKSLSYVW